VCGDGHPPPHGRYRAGSPPLRLEGRNEEDLKVVKGELKVFQTRAPTAVTI
jgi:hypothetical protein